MTVHIKMLCGQGHDILATKKAGLPMAVDSCVFL